MSINKPYASVEELAPVIPLFPLAGALLLPRGQLPLNIFEPRYLAMIDDAMKSHRLIGMIQPLDEQSPTAAEPALESIGCVGRIVQIAETGDGRYMLGLTGVIRFKLVEELTVMTPYRQGRADYSDYVGDFTSPPEQGNMDRAGVLRALKSYAQKNGFKIDWNGVDQAPDEALINALSMMSPFGAREKQKLLEANDIQSRAETLIALAEADMHGGASATLH